MITTFIIGLILLAAGIGIGYIIRHEMALARVNTAETKAEQIISQTKVQQRDLLLQAKDKAMAIIEEAKKDEMVRHKELSAMQQRIERRESLFDQKLIELQDRHQKIQEKTTAIDALRVEIEQIKQSHITTLESIAQLDREAAKNMLLEQAEKDAQEDIINRVRKVEKLGLEEMGQKAKSILADAVQRYAQSVVSETTTSIVHIPNDEMKGRIIGKEGRNIKSIENLTGVEILIDDTPNAITISGFSPIRRNIARIAIEKLIKDGRIHPGRIEEMIEEAKQELALDIKKAGEDAVFDLGVTGLDPRLIQILGRLKYRTSFGQNALLHSLEVGHLSGFLAEAIGADPVIARKGGLLHDIGKSVDHEVQGTHPQIGYDIMKKFGLPEEVAYMSIAHHEDNPRTIEGIVVKVADALSASRPGARKDSVERYIQRVTEIENVANSFEGIERAYAISAGREIRIFAHPDHVDDVGALKLAKNIAKRIEDELQYPGEIKVTLIREKRFVEYAR
ncbi:MAG: ribonuclease Y [bacterium]|nr:ribonuclease Y [bacterium]